MSGTISVSTPATASAVINTMLTASCRIGRISRRIAITDASFAAAYSSGGSSTARTNSGSTW